jgi:hypothetical protein
MQSRIDQPDVVMRTLLAILYIALGMLLYFQYATDPTFALGITLLILLVLSALLLFNHDKLSSLRNESYAQHLSDLEAQGKLEQVSYQVSRALHYDDLSNGRAACFLEVDHGHLLCLYGQYLHEYSLGSASSGKPRAFPTRSLTLLRLKRNQALLDIRPEGETFEPTVIAQPSPEILRELDVQPHDGELFRNVRYDDLLRQLSQHPLKPSHD